MSEEGFLSRWSRRKRGLEAEPAAPPAEASPPPAPPADAPPAEPAFDPASLPPIADLTTGSDFAAFLRKEVPEALRRAALRRAWSLDPAIRDFVGPADYAWDYNVPGGVPGSALDLVGDVQQLLAQALGLDREDPPQATAPADEPAAPGAPPAEAPAFIPPADLAEAPEAAPPVEAPDRAEPAPRRHGSARPA